MKWRVIHIPQREDKCVPVFLMYRHVGSLPKNDCTGEGLNLSICLWMVYGVRYHLYAKMCAYGCKKLGSTSWSAVG